MRDRLVIKIFNKLLLNHEIYKWKLGYELKLHNWDVEAEGLKLKGNKTCAIWKEIDLLGGRRAEIKL